MGDQLISGAQQIFMALGAHALGPGPGSPGAQKHEMY